MVLPASQPTASATDCDGYTLTEQLFVCNTCSIILSRTCVSRPSMAIGKVPRKVPLTARRRSCVEQPTDTEISVRPKSTSSRSRSLGTFPPVSVREHGDVTCHRASIENLRPQVGMPYLRALSAALSALLLATFLMALITIASTHGPNTQSRQRRIPSPTP